VYTYNILVANLEKRKDVMNFIRDNQGCKAQDIVDGLKQVVGLSRVPIFDILVELVKEGAVTDEKVNRREHRFFLNDDNPLVSVPRELDQFKGYFFKLIDEVNSLFGTKIEEHLRENNVDDLEWKMLSPATKKSSILYSLLELYQHLVGMYILRSLTIWPNKIKSKETRTKLFTEVFNRFQEIQLKLTSKPFAPSNEVGHYDIATDSLFELRPNILDDIANNFHRIGVDKQFEPVLDFLWEISNKSIPFNLLSSHKSSNLVDLIDENGKLKDWGIFVE
jgi:hypothetical protein